MGAVQKAHFVLFGVFGPVDIPAEEGAAPQSPTHEAAMVAAYESLGEVGNTNPRRQN